MHRSIALCALLSACASAAPPEASSAAEPLSLGVTRDHVVGDVYHYGFTIRVGSGPNGILRVHRVVRERAPYWPRATTSAVLEMHGDFASFTSNFLPSLASPANDTTGMATWLAQRGVDVWGLDRRWTVAPAGDADVSDFAEMGLQQELDDIGAALAFARGVRLLTDGSLARMTLVGFSRGGQLAYAYASQEAARPPGLRHLKGLVPLDVYAQIAPEDEDIRQFYCAIAPDEAAAVAAGFIDSTNDFQIDIGAAALAAPDELSTNPFFPPGLTNRDVMLRFAGRTYRFFPASPVYHLAAPVLDEGGFPVGLRETDEAVVAKWFAASPPHQSYRESAETDALLCGDTPPAADVPLARIRIPLFLIAAAGGYGQHAVFTTTQVGSTDVSSLVIRRQAPEDEAEDFGHGDLLYGRDAAALAWTPLLSWLRRHE